MTADPSATPGELAHYGAIARQLTGSRRQVLEAVDRCGPVDLGGLTDCWRDRYPDETARLGDRVDHLATGLLWKLEALGWVDLRDGLYSSTPAGYRTLTAWPPDRLAAVSVETAATSHQSPAVRWR